MKRVSLEYIWVNCVANFACKRQGVYEGILPKGLYVSLFDVDSLARQHRNIKLMENQY